MHLIAVVEDLLVVVDVGIDWDPSFVLDSKMSLVRQETCRVEGTNEMNRCCLFGDPPVNQRVSLVFNASLLSCLCVCECGVVVCCGAGGMIGRIFCMCKFTTTPAFGNIPLCKPRFVTFIGLG